MKNQTKNILFINHTSKISGPSKSLLLLIKYLNHHYNCIVSIPEKGPYYEILKENNINVIIQNPRRRYLIKMCLFLLKNKISIIYGNNYSNDSYCWSIAGKILGITFVWHIREILSITNHSPYTIRKRLLNSDKIVAVSNAARLSIIENYPGCDVFVIYNGIDVDQYDNVFDRELLLDKYTLKIYKTIITMIGTINERKNQLDAIKAINIIDRDDCCLLIVGSVSDDNYYDKLIAYIKTNNLDNIKFLGSTNKINEIYGITDIFVHTPINDPHPRVVLEAMASQVPILAYDIDGISETLEHNKTGFLVQKGDVELLARKLNYIIDNKSDRDIIAHNALDKVKKKFTHKITAKKTVELIENIFNA